ncbi:MAG TPA: hypothetical protein VJT08_11285 [Terriglobales bacterium]|nr:hypothetical protein [Terriglobales bacterium]
MAIIERRLPLLETGYKLCIQVDLTYIQLLAAALRAVDDIRPAGIADFLLRTPGNRTP